MRLPGSILNALNLAVFSALWATSSKNHALKAKITTIREQTVYQIAINLARKLGSASESQIPQLIEGNQELLLFGRIQYSDHQITVVHRNDNSDQMPKICTLSQDSLTPKCSR